MRFFSRTSRQPTPERPASTAEHPGVETDGTNTSPSSPQRMDSEGYPSWLPQRPPPPAPTSTFHSSTVGLEAGPSVPAAGLVGGRKATPRSVRIVSLPDSSYGDEKDRREPTDHTRVASSNHLHQRVWSRATGGALSPTVFSTEPYSRIPKPRFNAPSLRLDIVRSNNLLVLIYFYLFRVFIFAHLVLQTFFDFNAVFIIIQVSKYPTPQASNVPGSGRTWALGAAAYIACWFLQIFGVFIAYELVYSFIRRWRVRRPSIYPIYSSTPAFNFVAVTSFSRFCFLQNLRYAAFMQSLRDGLAETFWYYSQNLPTISLLLPRAGLCLAVLLTFSSPQAGSVTLAAAGVTPRDGTFFRDNGTLTDYSRGILIANASWTAWRWLVLVYSWIGLWILSEQGCAGICGPRSRWEEDEFENTVAKYTDNNIDERPPDLVWSWRECTRERIQDLFDFCLVAPKVAVRERDLSEDERVTEQVMAAVGLGPHASRRPVLTDDFFKGPSGSAILSAEKPLGEDQGGPLLSLPYPFTSKGTAQVSSDDEKIPFPPSPSLPSEEKTSDEKESSGTTGDEEGAEGDDEEMDADEEDAQEERLAVGESEEPSSGRASGSMSSLGHPVSSRYPFHFRHPTRGTSMSSSTNSPAASHATPQSNKKSIQSRMSGATQSTGNAESTDSHSPRSHYTSSDAASAASPSSVLSGAIPMPPRHPNRSRAGTVPSASPPSTPSPVNFPRASRPRTRADSGITQTFGAPQPGLDFDEDNEGADEPETGDIVGLLSPRSGLSPRSSFIHRSRASTASSGSRSNSHSGSSSGGARSRVESARSRAQSFIAAASRSSLELVRPRAHSMVRLDEEYSSGGHSRSGSGSGSGENWTFGHPAAWMRGTSSDRRDPPSPVQEEFRPDVQERRSPPSPVQERRESEEARGDDLDSVIEPEHYNSGSGDIIPVVIRASQSDLSLSQRTTASTVQQNDIPVFRHDDMSLSSQPDISTAAASFVTAPATITTTDESVRTIPSYPHLMERQGHGWGPA